MKKVAVVLSGCGVYDGAEIHESVLTLLALDRRNARVTLLAPDGPQMHVVNHLTGETTTETRNIRVESARIARGEVRDLAQSSPDEFDAIVFPGGFGVAKNLCDFALKGAECVVNPEVERFVRGGLSAGIAMGFICIAPALMARIARELDIHPRLTIGNDPETAATIRDMGADHVDCPVGQCVVDENHRIVSTPAYMLGQRISEVAEGIDNLVENLLELV